MLDDLALVLAPALDVASISVAAYTVSPRPASRRAKRSTKRALLGPEPRRLSRGGVLARVLGSRVAGMTSVDALVGERPLEQRLRPGRDPELAQRCELLGRGGRRSTRPRRAAASRSRPGRARPRAAAAALALALARVERQLDDVEAAACAAPLRARRTPTARSG